MNPKGRLKMNSQIASNIFCLVTFPPKALSGKLLCETANPIPSQRGCLQLKKIASLSCTCAVLSQFISSGKTSKRTGNWNWALTNRMLNIKKRKFHSGQLLIVDYRELVRTLIFEFRAVMLISVCPKSYTLYVCSGHWKCNITQELNFASSPSLTASECPPSTWIIPCW